MRDEASIPDGWVETVIRDVLGPLDSGRILQHGWSPRCEKRPSPSDGDWGVLKTTAVQFGAFFAEFNKALPARLKPRPQLEVCAGDLLLTCAGPRSRCGIPCLVRTVRPKLMFSGKMYRFRPATGIDSRFLEAHLMEPGIQTRIDQIKTGSSDSGLNLTHDRFLSIRLTVAPFVEQRAIVEKIEALCSELDKAVEQLEVVRQQFQRYRQAVLKAAFEGRLTAEWRAKQLKTGTLPAADGLLGQIKAERARRYQQQLVEWEEVITKWEADGRTSKKPRKPATPKDPRPVSGEELTDLPDLPQSWVWVRTETLAQPERPITYGVIKLGKDIRNGVPTLRSSNVRHLHLALDHVKRIAPSIAGKFDRTFLTGGEVLVTVRGTLGGVAVVPSECKGFNVSREVAPIAPLTTVNPVYLQYVIGSWYVQHWIEPRLRGIAYTGINIETLKALPIALCSVAEQAEIAQQIESRFSVLDELEKAVDRGLEQTEALRWSILKKAFKGRLLSDAELEQVRTDPAYELADQLLGRIRAERRQVETSKSRRGRKPESATPTRTIKLPKGERYRQAAFAAYAVNRLANRQTFGRVQQMKYLYLVPHVLAQESHIHARREAAGPLDPAIHKIEGLARRNGWFTVSKSGKRYSYRPSGKIAEACRFARQKFGDKADRVDWLLDQFAKMDTEQAELLATTFAVWNDALIDSHNLSKAEIVKGVHGWHPDKAAKFPPGRIHDCIEWMKKNDFLPTGIGPKTLIVSDSG